MRAWSSDSRKNPTRCGRISERASERDDARCVPRWKDKSINGDAPECLSRKREAIARDCIRAEITRRLLSSLRLLSLPPCPAGSFMNIGFPAETIQPLPCYSSSLFLFLCVSPVPRFFLREVACNRDAIAYLRPGDEELHEDLTARFPFEHAENKTKLPPPPPARIKFA